MASVFNNRKFVVDEVQLNGELKGRKKGDFYYKFYNNKDKFYWCFCIEPTEKLLDTICKSLKLPNYIEIDEIEYQNGY